ncbi:MAG: hypothetical protein Q9227_004071 [Pyrenula ochraceoflavens]
MSVQATTADAKAKPQNADEKDLACISQSLYSVSLYDTFGPAATEFIVRHAELACVATSLPHIPTLLKIKPRLPNLKIIVSLDPLDAGELEGHSKQALLSDLAADLGVSIHYIEDVEKLGASLNKPYRPPQPSDIVTINYTSGTTGDPKGVVLTHRAAVSAMSGSMACAKQSGNDINCSYLPLAHIYGRLIEGTLLWSGGAIGYFHGNVLELVEDIKLLRPTVFTSVPRLWNRFGGVIRSQTTELSGFNGAVARYVVATKTANMNDKSNPSNTHSFWDRMWSRRIAGAIGLDRAVNMVSGAAPLDPSLHQFLRAIFSNNFPQGYGLTETYGSSLVQLIGDFTSGNCGAPIPCNEACLRSVPDMEYTVNDKPQPRGELLLRGPGLFSGYYKNTAETEKVMTEDGWFCTGDIATVDSLGRFQIIDRRKNVLKLAQGEYVSPERIEGVYLNACPYLATAFVHGDSSQTFLVAIFGVQPDVFAGWAGNILGTKIGPTDCEAIKKAASSKAVREAVLKDINKAGRKKKFAGFEHVKNCYVYLEPFSIDNDLLTPTLKLKRPPTVKKYRKELDALYAEALNEEKTKPKAKL